LAQNGDIDGALAEYAYAQEFDPQAQIAAPYWIKLCLQGAVHKAIEKVTTACGQAVTSAPNDPWSHDARGIMRFLIGDRQGAIDDFKQVLTIEETIPTIANSTRPEPYQQWIERLEAGEPPFDDASLKALVDLRMALP
jgi:hypothetical protein